MTSSKMAAQCFDIWGQMKNSDILGQMKNLSSQCACKGIRGQMKDIFGQIEKLSYKALKFSSDPNGKGVSTLKSILKTNKNYQTEFNGAE